MAKKNNTKRINKGYRSEEQTEAIRFVRILVILIIIVLGVYFFTRIFVTKDLFKKEEEEAVAGEINYSVTLIGNMLNKAEEEYYVFIYNSEDLNASYYGTLAYKYSQNEKPLPIFTADLQNELNKKYYDSEKSNLNAKDLNDFRVKEVALLKIEKGKITKTLENESDIAKELAYTKKDTSK